MVASRASRAAYAALKLRRGPSCYLGVLLPLPQLQVCVGWMRIRGSGFRAAGKPW